MRLLSHNLLMWCVVLAFTTCVVSPRKECTEGYPLAIRASSPPETRTTQPENYSADFVRSVVRKLDWAVFRAAAAEVSAEKGSRPFPHFKQFGEHLPPAIGPEELEDEEVCQRIYDVAMNMEIQEADLECPQCHRLYPVRGGIPNLLVDEKKTEEEEKMAD